MSIEVAMVGILFAAAFMLAFYDVVQAMVCLWGMIVNIADPRYAWLGGFLLFSDRFFNEEGAKYRHRFARHFFRGWCVIVVLVTGSLAL